jgi:hypothetical protein
MVPLAQELVNDNGVSSVALAFFSVLVGGVVTVLVQTYKIKHTSREAASKADEASQKADQARENTQNISNGFAGRMDSRTQIIVDQISRLQSSVDRTNSSLTKHLEHHLEKGE